MNKNTLFTTLRDMPLEIGFSVYAFIMFLLSYNKVIFHNGHNNDISYVYIVPAFIMLAYVLNINFRLKGTISARKNDYPIQRNCNIIGKLIYWLTGLIFIPVEFICAKYGFGSSVQCIVTITILSPILVLISHRTKDNKTFINEGLKYFITLIISFAISIIVLLLFYAIFFSIIYIFGINNNFNSEYVVDIARYASFMIIFPVLIFIILPKVWENKSYNLPIMEKVFNWAIIPALLIYTLILYIYFISIVIKCDLPQGGIAYLVFGFTIASLAVGALMKSLNFKSYSWFFSNFSFISIPAIIIFWIGVIKRVTEYGFTDLRVYLIVCGLIMTISLAMMLSIKYGKYLYLFSTAFIMLNIVTFVPGISSKDIAIRSQEKIINDMSKALGIKSENGKLDLSVLSTVGNNKKTYLKRLYSALSYIESHDTVSFNKMGIISSSDLKDALPANLFNYIISDDLASYNSNNEIRIFNRNNELRVDNISGNYLIFTSLPLRDTTISGTAENKGYNQLFKNQIINIYNGSDPVITIDMHKMFMQQLEKCGFGPDKLPTLKELKTNAEKLLILRSENYIIKFSSINIRINGDNYKIHSYFIDCIMQKIN